MLAEIEPDTAVDVKVLRKGRKETVKGFVLSSAKEQRWRGERDE